MVKIPAAGDPVAIRNYTREMAVRRGNPRGGFPPRFYRDPVGAGHKEESPAKRKEGSM